MQFFSINCKMDRRKKNRIAFIIIVLVFGVPLMIHCLFKCRTTFPFLVAEWSAGELLAYYGAVLSFMSTILFSWLALHQNELIRQEANKNNDLLKKMEIEKLSPFFTLEYINGEGYGKDASVKLKNVSANLALDVSFTETEKTNDGKKYIQGSCDEIISILEPRGEAVINLKNGNLYNGNVLSVTICCKDIYGNINKFEAEGFFIDKQMAIKFCVHKIR